jgi:hypothetical protein
MDRKVCPMLQLHFHRKADVFMVTGSVATVRLKYTRQSPSRWFQLSVEPSAGVGVHVMV